MRRFPILLLALIGCAKPQLVPVSGDRILTLMLPASFSSAGLVRQDMRRAIYRFTEHQTTDWGGYAQYPVVLHVTVFNPAIVQAHREQASTSAFEFFASDLAITDRARIPWTEPNGAVKVAPVTYKKNLTEEPAWVVSTVRSGFVIDFYAWRKKYSADRARALVEQAAASVKLANLEEHWRDVADQPRRAREAREAKLARMLDMLKAAGWPAPAPAGEVREHRGFLYAVSKDRSSFGVAYKLGELERPSRSRVDFVLPVPEQERLPDVWYYPEEGEWQVADNSSPWKPTDELLAHLRASADRGDTVYFYAVRGFSWEYTDIGDFELVRFAEGARRLAELFTTGHVARVSARP